MANAGPDVASARPMRVGGTACALIGAGDAQGATKADLLVEDAACEVADAGELAGAACQHRAAACQIGEAAFARRARIISKISSRRGCMILIR